MYEKRFAKMAAPFKNSNFGCFSAMDRLILQFVTGTLFVTSGFILLIYFVLATQIPVCAKWIGILLHLIAVLSIPIDLSLQVLGWRTPRLTPLLGGYSLALNTLGGGFTFSFRFWDWSSADTEGTFLPNLSDAFSSRVPRVFPGRATLFTLHWREVLVLQVFCRVEFS
jgi:hypothetical protein